MAQTLQLRRRVENDLVAVSRHLPDILLRERHAECVGVTAEFLKAEPGFEGAAARGAIEIRPKDIEDTPGREALQGEHDSGSGTLLQDSDTLQVLKQIPLANH